MKRKKNSNIPNYASIPKQALNFGSPSLESLLDYVFIAEEKETYDSTGSPVYLTGNAPEHKEQNSVYRIESSNIGIAPNIRPVTVHKKENYRSFLFEPQNRSRGIVVVMGYYDGTSARCNIRYLPYSTLSDIYHSCSNSESELTIELPEKEIIKLNMSMFPSSTGEILYSTHKTEVKLDDVTEGQEIELKEKLEFQVAPLLAHYCGDLIEVVSSDSMISNEALSGNYSLNYLGNYSDIFGIPSNLIKKILLYVGLGASTVAVVTSATVYISTGVSIAASWAFLESIGPYTGALSGLLRNTAALIPSKTPEPIYVGSTYRVILDRVEKEIEFVEKSVPRYSELVTRP